MLETIARHELILATGAPRPRRHLRGRRRRVRGGREDGRRHAPRVHRARTSRSRTRSRSPSKGCLLERCLTTPHSGKTTYEHVFDGVRAVGIERNFFSSDCGNPDYPPVEDGLALWADQLLEAGFGEDEIRTMVVENSRRLAGDSLADLLRERTRSSCCATRRPARTSTRACRPSSRTGGTSSRPGRTPACSSTSRTTWPTWPSRGRTR